MFQRRRAPFAKGSSLSSREGTKDLEVKRRTVTTVFSVLISLVAVIYVVAHLDWQMTYDTLTHLKWGWLGAALLVFFVNYVLRTWRFQTLIYTQRVPFQQLMAVTSLYGMFNYLLPAKSGEFSFLLLLNRRLGISWTEGTVTLVAARFFDFATIALFLPAVLIVFWEKMPPGMIYAALIFCGLIYVLGAGLVWFLSRSQENLVPRRRIGDTSKSWTDRLTRVWRNLVKGLRLIYQRDQFWRLCPLTIGIWLCVYANFYLIVLSMGHRLSYLEMTVVSIIMVPMTLLPVQGFANLGTHEAGWVAALALFGKPKEVSLTIAAGSHVVLLIFVLILGGVGLLLESRPNGPGLLIPTRGVDD
jgi:uncharacterized protein (TIRG00374 family)